MKTIATITRNAIIALGLNFRASRPDADRSSARMLPATTTTTPRSASLRRQRFRICRMISTSSARWLMDGSLDSRWSLDVGRWNSVVARGFSLAIAALKNRATTTNDAPTRRPRTTTNDYATPSKSDSRGLFRWREAGCRRAVDTTRWLAAVRGPAA